ncbi:MAG: nucleotide exchange factor GrpE [Deltaproteobacteria bacterium]|nr:nucleotide exchange factor GrpE [Deltaproteobacteria bacterium]
MDETTEKEKAEFEEEASGEDEAAGALSEAETLKKELEAKLSAFSELNDKYLRKCADFDNYRKRMEKEKYDIAAFATENLMRELLNVIDNFDRAFEHAAKGCENEACVKAAASIKEGINHTVKSMHSTLTRFGLEPITAEGEKFDHSLHEALGEEERTDVEPGMIVKELQKGYLLKKRLLRPSRVIISKAAQKSEVPPDAESAPDSEPSPEGTVH